MLSELIYTASGGGGGAVSGETDAITSASETITINTGLSTIKRFYAFIYLTDWTPNYLEFVHYDADHSTTTYIGGTNYGPSNYGGLNVTLGTYPNANYSMKMDAPSGGMVTLTTAVSANYAGTGKKIRWFAE